jgi:hypothetical protein
MKAAREAPNDAKNADSAIFPTAVDKGAKNIRMATERAQSEAA